MSDSMPPRRDRDQIINEMVNETEIKPGTRPFIKVHLKGVEPNSNESILKTFYDSNISFLNSMSTFEGRWPTGSYTALLGRDIVDAEFESETLGTRRGHVNISDPLGVWTEIIAKVSAHADRAGRGFPNIEILFGWIDLEGDNPDKIQSVYGIVTKTNFSLGENGIMSLTIHFVESAMDLLANLRFISFEDMLSTDPDSDDSEIEDKMAPHAALNALIENSSLSTKVKTSETSGDDGQALTLILEETNNSNKSRVKMKDYSVRFGDKFYDKLQAIIAKAKPPEILTVVNPESGEEDEHPVNKDENDYIYQILEKKTYVPEDDPEVIKSYIRYGWEIIPRSSDDNPEPNSFPGAFRIGSLFWKKNDDMGGYTGGSLVAATESNKTALTIDIDLRSFAHLHALIQGQMNKYLNSMDEKDWERIEGNLEDIRTSPEGRLSSDEILEAQEQDRKWWRRNSRDESDEEYQERYEAVENLLEIVDDMDSSEDEEGPPASSQIRALIRQFSFQVKVTILGDPAFGTYLEPAKGYFISEFGGLGRFAGYLTGLKLLFMKATHKFGNDGTYKTELELRSTPPDASQGGDSDTGDDTALIGGSVPDLDSMRDFRGLGDS